MTTTRSGQAGAGGIVTHRRPNPPGCRRCGRCGLGKGEAAFVEARTAEHRATAKGVAGG